MVEVVSIHIPKTAGRSFLSILNNVYKSESVSHFDRKNFPDKDIPEIEQFKLQLRDDVKVIHGHFSYKEIEGIRNISRARIITWLRDPVDRVISNYSFFKKRIYLSSEDIELQNRKEESLMDYASLDSSRNRMSKFMDGLALNDFFFIGIKERFESDVARLGKLLEWGSFQVPRINDNSDFKAQLPEITSREKKMIEDLNRIDIELYRKVLEMHNRRIN